MGRIGQIPRSEFGPLAVFVPVGSYHRSLERRQRRRFASTFAVDDAKPVSAREGVAVVATMIHPVELTGGTAATTGLLRFDESGTAPQSKSAVVLYNHGRGFGVFSGVLTESADSRFAL